MKYQLILTVSLLFLILTVGCSSTQSNNAISVTTRTPIVTASTQHDSIIGVWGGVVGPNDYRIQVNSDGTLLYTNNGGADITQGTWVLKGTLDSGDTAYTVSSRSTIETYVYSKTKNAIYSTSYPTLLFTPYQGYMGLTTPTPQISTLTPTQTSTIISSTSGDQAAIDKMIEMNEWMSPTMDVIGDSAVSGNYLKLGLNALLLQKYIDQNLPEMRRLATVATSKKAAALEYVSGLEDIRTSADLTVQAVDTYNSGNINEGTELLLKANTYTKRASLHFQTVTALL